MSPGRFFAAARGSCSAPADGSKRHRSTLRELVRLHRDGRVDFTGFLHVQPGRVPRAVPARSAQLTEFMGRARLFDHVGIPKRQTPLPERLARTSTAEARATSEPSRGGGHRSCDPRLGDERPHRFQRDGSGPLVARAHRSRLREATEGAKRRTLRRRPRGAQREALSWGWATIHRREEDRPDGARAARAG